jgi:hypothetical protein
MPVKDVISSVIEVNVSPAANPPLGVMSTKVRAARLPGKDTVLLAARASCDTKSIIRNRKTCSTVLILK